MTIVFLFFWFCIFIVNKNWAEPAVVVLLWLRHGSVPIESADHRITIQKRKHSAALLFASSSI